MLALPRFDTTAGENHHVCTKRKHQSCCGGERPGHESEVASHAFDFARSGEATALRTVISKGMPPNLRNEKSDFIVV